MVLLMLGLFVAACWFQTELVHAFLGTIGRILLVYAFYAAVFLAIAYAVYLATKRAKQRQAQAKREQQERRQARWERSSR